MKTDLLLKMCIWDSFCPEKTVAFPVILLLKFIFRNRLRMNLEAKQEYGYKKEAEGEMVCLFVCLNKIAVIVIIQ